MEKNGLCCMARDFLSHHCSGWGSWLLSALQPSILITVLLSNPRSLALYANPPYISSIIDYLPSSRPYRQAYPADSPPIGTSISAFSSLQSFHNIDIHCSQLLRPSPSRLDSLVLWHGHLSFALNSLLKMLRYMWNPVKSFCRMAQLTNITS